MSEYRLALAVAPPTVSANRQLRRPMTKGRMAFSQAECRVPNYAASLSTVAILRADPGSMAPVLAA
jgi:hypothetical protein